jgi:hypothetical protein
MGSVSPPRRLVPKEIMDGIHDLLSSATKAGVVIIDARAEAQRLLSEMPECHMTVAEIADAIAQVSIQHPYVGIVLSRSALEGRGGEAAAPRPVSRDHGTRPAK